MKREKLLTDDLKHALCRSKPDSIERCLILEELAYREVIQDKWRKSNAS